MPFFIEDKVPGRCFFRSTASIREEVRGNFWLGLAIGVSLGMVFVLAIDAVYEGRRAAASQPLTPALSPEYRGEGEQTSLRSAGGSAGASPSRITLSPCLPLPHSPPHRPVAIDNRPTIGTVGC